MYIITFNKTLLPFFDNNVAVFGNDVERNFGLCQKDEFSRKTRSSLLPKPVTLLPKTATM